MTFAEMRRRVEEVLAEGGGVVDMCIRCGEAPSVDELGYCGHCHWAVRTEIESGFSRLREYLRAWARFRDWEGTREP